MSKDLARKLLTDEFEARHIDAALAHFSAVIEKFVAEDWDGVALKAGKFVEAVTKALSRHCGRIPATGRKFKAGTELRALEQTDSTKYSEIVRLVVPKVCLAIYEIVNNRGGRHDADEIDANEMDAKVIVPQVQWTLAELVRFASAGNDTASAESMIEEFTNKAYPLFEKVGTHTYVDTHGLTAPDVTLLLLYEAYPNGIERHELIDAIVRHGHKRAAASMAVQRLKTSYDDQNGELKLRGIGRRAAEAKLNEIAVKKGK